MSTLDGVMLFGQSQSSKVHFENQRVLMVREKVMSPESRRLRFFERLAHCAKRWQSQTPDTDSRLLTEMNRGGTLLKPTAPSRCNADRNFRAWDLADAAAT